MSEQAAGRSGFRKYRPTEKGIRHLIPRYLKVYPKTKGKEILSLHAHTKTARTEEQQNKEKKME